MKTKLLSIIVTAGMLSLGTAQASPELAKSAGCTKCHDMDKTKKGAPGFKEAAAKWKGKPDAEATIFQTISDAKGDHPEIKVKEADARSVIKWVLSL